MVLAARHESSPNALVDVSGCLRIVVEDTLANDQSSSGVHVQINNKDGDTISLYETPPDFVALRTDTADDLEAHNVHRSHSERYGRVWIEYATAATTDNDDARKEGERPTLKIYVNNKNEYKPQMPQVVIGPEELMLTEIFNPQEEIHVGWTSSVNGLGQRDNHDILSWTGILEEGEREENDDDGGASVVGEEEEDTNTTETSASLPSGTEDDVATTTEENNSAYEYKYVDEMIAVDNIMSYGDKVEIFDPQLAEYFAEGPDKLFDNTTTKFFYGWSHSPNDNIDNAIILTPSLSSCTILQGITFYVANDIPERDWTSIRIEGRKTFNTTHFQLIQNVNFDLPNERNQAFEDIDPNKHFHQTIMFEDNVEAYIQYRINILGTKGSLSSQVGEIVMPGLLCPRSYISDDVQGGGTGGDAEVSTLEVGDSTSAAIRPELNFTSNAGDVWSFYDNLLSINDRIEMVGATTRFGRDVTNLVDGKTDKAILFPNSYHQDPVDPNIVSDFSGGFQVVPEISACTVVQGMTLFMSNHYIGRDPASYKLEGRHIEYDVNGTVQAISPYEVISEGSFQPPVERNKDSELIDINKHSHVSLVINNTIPYQQYRVVFPRMRGFPIFYSSTQQGIEMQLSEIWFAGYTCPPNRIGGDYSDMTAALLPPPPTETSSGSQNDVLEAPPSLSSSPNNWSWKESLLQFGDPIQQYGGINAMGETAFEMYDGTTNKWLMFIHQDVVPGVEVTPTVGPYTIVQG